MTPKPCFACGKPTATDKGARWFDPEPILQEWVKLNQVRHGSSLDYVRNRLQEVSVVYPSSTFGVHARCGLRRAAKIDKINECYPLGLEPDDPTVP